MRKFKKEVMNNDIVEDKIELNEKKYTKIIIAISWLIPFFGLYFIYFLGIKLPKRTKVIMSQILNKNFTMIFIYLVLFSTLRTLNNSLNGMKINFILILIVFLFIISITFSIIKSYQWLNGKDVRYKHIFKFFKED